ncbi:cytochrome P450 [Hygrophoropsis aurantiaca]|uniref:Cytochrome P450 n=1 Tax=Hygrophoropsis aurantiaca TaxID=72124 RepID=A0ACB8AQK4_9AGAM|nr:cytochrome P450 [Hygrophoropsis aurantiaca]
MIQVPELTSVTIVALLSVVVGVLLTNKIYGAKSQAQALPLPPRIPVPTHWLFGQKLPLKYPSLAIAKWVDNLGPLISMTQGRQPVVVIGRYKAAMDIMERQGGLLVDRPRSIAAGELFAGGMSILLTPAGERFKRMRRALHTHLQPKAAEGYEHLQMDNAKTTILDLLQEPDQFQNHARKYAATVIQKIAYGKNTPSPASDPEVQSIRKSFDVLRDALRPGAYLVDSFPFLKYLPWYGRKLRREHEVITGVYLRQLDRVKQELKAGKAGLCFGSYILEHNQEYGLSEKEIAYLAGAFFSAGSDTTAIAICTFMFAAARHPAAQAKVHEELDSIVGNERAPTFADESKLPQLQAFMMESMRWRPVVALGLPHRATEDIIWENYVIPAGTTVYGNHWAISRDPQVFPDPEKFDPQRWIDDDGQFRHDIKFPTFGFGRRICPGLHVANRSLFINAALILWSFRSSLHETEPIDDLSLSVGIVPELPPSTMKFEPRIDAKELESIMEKYPEGM